MAVTFLAMNDVFGEFFTVDKVEAFEPEAAAIGSVPAGTFIFDDQLHHVSDAWSNPSSPIKIPSGLVSGPHLSFDHWVAFENGYDGGQLMISVNGGKFYGLLRRRLLDQFYHRPE